MSGMTEYTFPDDSGSDKKSKDKEDDFEIEVVDDTPEPDRNRKPLEREVDDPSEEELQQYGDKVKSRIKELTHARHDERRAKEALQREKEEALRLAQAAMEENARLKSRVHNGETTVVNQAQRLTEFDLDRAKMALRAAHESGDTDAFVEAQAKLNEAQIRADKIKALKPERLREDDAPATVAPEQAQQAAQPQPDARAVAWREANRWFGEDDEMTSYALGLHSKLVKQGVDPQSQTYYDTINRRVREVFPETFRGTADKAEPARRPATVVAPVNRATSAKKVTLTQTQVQIAKRLGVPLEIYARQVAVLEQKNG